MRKSYYPELQERLTELERFRTLLDRVAEAIILAEAGQERIVDANQAACDFLGVSRAGLIGRSVARVLGGSLGAAVADRLAEGGPPSGVLEGLLAVPGGPVTPVEVQVSVEIFGGVPYAVILARDVTEQRAIASARALMNERLELQVALRTRELEDANRRLQELDSLKSGFLSAVSHDLRTPLTSILGFAKLVDREFGRAFEPLGREEPVLSRRARRIRENLAVIQAEGERLTRLINDVLDLSRIESGRMPWREARVAPRELARQAVRAVRGRFAQKRGLALRVELDPGLAELIVDPDRILQVLINLLDNALKFTERGVVTMGAGLNQAGEAVLCVSDTGPGIPAAEQASIFESFHQLAGDTLDGRPKGSGLGLAICSQIVAHYGGRLWVESEPGRGSRFSFSLPAELVVRKEEN
jgi:PAS domain S-box-containing protein